MNMVKIGKYHYINMDSVNFVARDNAISNGLTIHFTNGDLKSFRGEDGEQLLDYLEFSKMNIYKGK